MAKRRRRFNLTKEGLLSDKDLASEEGQSALDKIHGKAEEVDAATTMMQDLMRRKEFEDVAEEQIPGRHPNRNFSRQGIRKIKPSRLGENTELPFIDEIDIGGREPQSVGGFEGSPEMNELVNSMLFGSKNQLGEQAASETIDSESLTVTGKPREIPETPIQTRVFESEKEPSYSIELGETGIEKTSPQSDVSSVDDIIGAAIAALVPSVGGALFGGKQGFAAGAREGVKVGETFLKAIAEEDKLKARTAKGGVGDKPLFYPTTIRDPETGENVLGSFNARTGEIKESGKISGKSYQSKVDPRTGELIISDPSVPGKVLELKSMSDRPFDVRQTKELEKFRDTWINQTSDQKEALSAAGKIEAVLDSKNAIGDNIAKFFSAKLADSGKLSDQDVAMFGGSKGFAARARQAAETIKTGRLSNENRALLRDLATILKNRAKMKMDNISAGLKKSEKALSGLSKKQIDSVINPIYNSYIEQGRKDFAGNNTDDKNQETGFESLSEEELRKQIKELEAGE